MRVCLGSAGAFIVFPLILYILLHDCHAVVLRNPAFNIWGDIFGNKAEEPLRSPVILVPGVGGSRLQAKLNKPNTVSLFCAKQTKDYIDLWLNVDLLLPYALECWVDNMKLHYNNVSRRSENAPGVDVRVYGFGSSLAVEYVSKDLYPYARYFKDVADMLVSQGYERDISIRAAPYDFRLAPDEQTEYYKALKKLVEETHTRNQNTPVTFIAHSLGNLHTLYFLQQQTPEWTAKHVKGFVSIAAPWAGAIRSIKAVTSGDNLNEDIVDSLMVRAEERTNPSATFLFPNREFWPDSYVVLQRPGKQYTVGRIDQLIDDINDRSVWDMYGRTKGLLKLQPPSIPMFCLYGTGVPTPASLYYERDDQFPDLTPKEVLGQGDGSVNDISLEVCGQWAKKHPERVRVTRFPGVGHKEILADQAALAHILDVLNQ
ncbi:phospholipase A2 group XV-like [Paramacrobiotus metropolitanus]|uniref:phospholipase A2 group XV-like n=1 Tax=Paramacrobiotus metropolitanus TaxID=2943436 RepID=UPI002445A40A|nr:phospholipase A2 group XV-like [Paramacrobiotus metropolitanus]